MKVDEFVNGFNKALKSKSSVNTVEKYIEKHITKKYLPYAMKMAEAHNIVKSSSYYADADTKRFRLNSPARYILFVVSVLTHYTDIEFGKNVSEDYDALAECGALEGIITAIGEDYDVFQTVVNMTLDDEMSNERELASFFEHRIVAAQKMLENVDVDSIVTALQGGIV